MALQVPHCIQRESRVITPEEPNLVGLLDGVSPNIRYLSVSTGFDLTNNDVTLRFRRGSAYEYAHCHPHELKLWFHTALPVQIGIAASFYGDIVEPYSFTAGEIIAHHGDITLLCPQDQTSIIRGSEGNDAWFKLGDELLVSAAKKYNLRAHYEEHMGPHRPPTIVRLVASFGDWLRESA